MCNKSHPQSDRQVTEKLQKWAQEKSRFLLLFCHLLNSLLGAPIVIFHCFLHCFCQHIAILPLAGNFGLRRPAVNRKIWFATPRRQPKKLSCDAAPSAGNCGLRCLPEAADPAGSQPDPKRPQPEPKRSQSDPRRAQADPK